MVEVSASSPACPSPCFSVYLLLSLSLYLLIIPLFYLTFFLLLFFFFRVTFYTTSAYDIMLMGLVVGVVGGVGDVGLGV